MCFFYTPDRSITINHTQHSNLCEFTIIFSDRFQKIPTSLNTTLGSTAQFNCSYHGGHAIFWYMYVDGELINREYMSQNGISYQTTTTRDGFFDSTLSVVATERSNNSRVECGVFIFGHGVIKPTAPETAILKIQGEISNEYNLIAWICI